MDDLDNFFKKKDKYKAKKSAAAAASKVHIIDQGKTKNKLTANGDDDGWMQLPEEEKKKDYTGLKLQNLKANEEEAARQLCQSIQDNKMSKSPWKIIEKGQGDMGDEQTAINKEVQTHSMKVDGSIMYITPGMRQGLLEKKKSNKKESLDVDCQQMFPALSKTIPK